jgi:Helix-turn-helix domain
MDNRENRAPAADLSLGLDLLPRDGAVLNEMEAARLLRIAPETLAALRRKGQAPPYSRVGKGRILYLRGDILGWLRARRVNGKAK